MVPLLVPPPWVNTTVSPPAGRLFPAPSLAWSVSVAVAPDTTVLLAVVPVHAGWAAFPCVTVFVASTDVTGFPPMVAPMVVAVPAVPPVNVAVYVPLLLSVVPPIVPVLVPPVWVNTTVSPPAVRLFPAASLACSGSVGVHPDTPVTRRVGTADVPRNADPG